MLFPFHDDNPTRRLPVVTIALILANIVSLAYLWKLEPEPRAELIARRGFVPQRLWQFAEQQKRVAVPVQWLDQNGRKHEQQVQLDFDTSGILLSLITSVFLHGSLIHLLGNMWFLWLFGNNIEDRLGHVLFFALLPDWRRYCVHLSLGNDAGRRGRDTGYWRERRRRRHPGRVRGHLSVRTSAHTVVLDLFFHDHRVAGACRTRLLVCRPIDSVGGCRRSDDGRSGMVGAYRWFCFGRY